jgi:lipopolysaccharide/colanic/teichoic acid biosynthesis glycosyltransferase
LASAHILTRQAIFPNWVIAVQRDWFAPNAPTLAQVRLARIGDVIIASALILFTAPLMALVCVALKLEDGGPIFDTVPSFGPGSQLFGPLKFRTTKPPAVRHSGECETRVGQVLRYARIEELPQLFNVLRGDVRLLGPTD